MRRTMSNTMPAWRSSTATTQTVAPSPPQNSSYRPQRGHQRRLALTARQHPARGARPGLASSTDHQIPLPVPQPQRCPRAGALRHLHIPLAELREPGSTQRPRPKRQHSWVNSGFRPGLHGRLQVCQLMTTDTSAATSPSRGMPRAAPDLINLGSIGKTESDLYDIKIEASGLVKLRDKANRTSPTARRAPGRTSALTTLTSDLIPPCVTTRSTEAETATASRQPQPWGRLSSQAPNMAFTVSYTDLPDSRTWR